MRARSNARMPREDGVPRRHSFSVSAPTLQQQADRALPMTEGNDAQPLLDGETHVGDGGEDELASQQSRLLPERQGVWMSSA